MLAHHSRNFEIQRYYQNEPRFNGVFVRNNLPKKVKYRAYVIKLGEHADVVTIIWSKRLIKENHAVKN